MVLKKSAAKKSAANKVPPTKAAARRAPAKKAAAAPTSPGDDVTVDQLIDSTGNGGETHQVAGAGRARLTTQQGVPVADDQNTLRVGDRGPALLEDFHFREKIFHFDHE